MCSDGIALSVVPAGGQHWTTQFGRFCTPVHQHGFWSIGAIVSRQGHGTRLTEIHLGDAQRITICCTVPKHSSTRRVFKPAHCRRSPRGARSLQAATILREHRVVNAFGQRVASGRAELSVSGITKTWHDVAITTKDEINIDCVDFHIRMQLMQLHHTRVGRTNANDRDLLSTPAFELRDRSLHSPRCCDHRLQDEGDVRNSVLGQPAVVLDGFGILTMSPEHADVVHHCIWQQLEHCIHHAQASTQNRNQSHRVRNPHCVFAQHGPNGGNHIASCCCQEPCCRLVADVEGHLVEQLPEVLRDCANITEQGHLVSEQRMA
mmetsp:Transcript_61962/g.202087  ORF Transcript_61962/g.202087 Transcript_61962/m.202087 type:complete len:320 (-) Transcript_61962:873-1832(-)